MVWIFLRNDQQCRIPFDVAVPRIRSLSSSLRESLGLWESLSSPWVALATPTARVRLAGLSAYFCILDSSPQALAF